MGTRSNVYPQSMFWAKIRKKNQKFSYENYHFYSREILQYIAQACLRNVMQSAGMLKSFSAAHRVSL